MKIFEKILEALKGQKHSEAFAIGSIFLIYLTGKLVEGHYEVSLHDGNFSFRPTQGVTEQKHLETKQNQPVQEKAKPAPEKPEQQAAEGQEEAEKKQPET